jgi:hypothetical protein
MANHSQTVITVAMAAFSSGWLSGLYFSRRPPRDQDPDWRRSFSHENTNRPGGPPPLKLRRCDPDSPENFIRMDEGRTIRGNGNGGLSIPKPEIIAKPQFPPGRIVSAEGRFLGYIPLSNDPLP